MKSLLFLAGGAVVGMVLSAKMPDTAHPDFEFPLIKHAGGIVPLPKVAEQPRAGAKIVLDITGENEPDKVTKGVDRAGVIMNLHAQAGVKPDQIQATIILHGPATRAALGDEAYARATGERKNPNLPVFRELKNAGVEVFVCGQALAHQKIAMADVAEEVTIAASASTVLTSRQMNGYAYMPFR